MIRSIVAVSLALSTAARGAEEIEPPRVSDDRLQIELVASEPAIVTPTGIAVDRRGRVFVAENHTHVRPDDYDGPEHDRVRLLEDTDGDSRYDKITTFFEGTRWITNLATHHDGSLWVSTRYTILRLRDTTGDGHADQRETMGTLRTEAAYPHNGLSGLAIDFDGSVYFTLGENRGADYQLVARDGTTIAGGRGAGCVFSCRADGTVLRRVATGLWNGFHLAFDAPGRLFVVDNDPGSGSASRLLHVVDGGDYGYRRKELSALIAWDGQLPGTLPMVTGTAEAPSGIVAYESDDWPDEYLGRLLVTAWSDHRVDAYTLADRGASLRASAEPLIVGSDDFRPVGIAVGPDGSVFISDWVSRSYPVHGRGRIWRVRAKKSPGGRGSDELRKTVVGVDRRAREQAARELAGQGGAGRTLLHELLRTHDDPKVRVSALRALSLGAVDVGTLTDVVYQDVSPLVRRAAVACLSLESADLVRVAGRDASASVRTEAVRRLSDPEALPVLLTELESSDPFRRQAARAALGNSLSNEQLHTLCRSDNSAYRLGALLVLRGKQPLAHDELLKTLLRDSDAAVRLAAVESVAVNKRRSLQDALVEGLQTGATTPRLLEVHLAALARLDGVLDDWTYKTRNDAWKQRADVQDAALRVLRDPTVSGEIRARTLAFLRADDSRVNIALIEELADQSHAGLQTELIRVLRESPTSQRRELLGRIARDRQRPAEVRAEAIVGLDGGTAAGRGLLVALALENSVSVRNEALRSLRGAVLGAEQKGRLDRIANRDAEAAELVQRLSASVGSTTVTRRESVDVWLRRTNGEGDAAAGGRVFFHPRGPGCYRCHRVDGHGAQLGPDLSAVAGNAGMTRRGMLEAIVDPSKEIAPQYIPWVLATKQGRVHTGIFIFEDNNRTQTYADSNGKRFTVEADEIEERKTQMQSIMPDGLVRTMTARELRDLLAYLMSLK